MKKLGLIVVVLAIIAGGWVYLANKFEHIAKEEILPKLENSETAIVADLNLIIIEKFKFKVIIPAITIFPESKYFKIVSDQLIVSYNPFTDKIAATFQGEKLSIGTGKTELYIPSPNQTINLDRSILQKELRDIDFQIISKEMSIYSAQDDKFITRSSGVTTNFSSKLDSNDVYLINLGANFNNMEVNPETGILSLLDESAPALIRKQFQLMDGYYRIAEQTGSINYNAQYSVNVGKEHIDDIIATIKGEILFPDIYKKFMLTKDKFSILAKDSFSNNAIKDNISVYFSGDGNKVDLDWDISLNRSYTPEQKTKIIDTTNILLAKLAKQIPSDKAINNVGPADFQQISTSITNAEKVGVSFHLNYDLATTNSDHSLQLQLDDFTTTTKGSLDKKIYTGTTTITTPELLISGLTSLYEGATPIFIKNLDEKNASFIKSFDQVMNNIKNNGFDALSAFHTENQLDKNESLILNIVANPQAFEFKINGKSILEFLTNEKIIKFLKSMPDETTHKN